jgi:hypothetical protein
MTDKKFENALKAAEIIVESWPMWKQNSLLVTSMATSLAPRQPVDAPTPRVEREDIQVRTTIPIKPE